jgi:hypothetical protein
MYLLQLQPHFSFSLDYHLLLFHLLLPFSSPLSPPTPSSVPQVAEISAA